MKTKIWFATSLVVVFALLVLATASCAVGTSNTISTPASGKPAATPGGPAASSESKGSAAASKEPYKIGGLFAVTGSASSLGTPERNTVQMLEEEINKNGGINGHPLQVVIRDTESDETKTVLAAKKLIDEDKVLAIIGPSQSGESLAVADTIEKAEVPMISAASSIKIVDPQKKWIFKATLSENLIVARLAEYLKSKNYSKIALLSASNAYGDAGKVEVEKSVPAAGMTLVAKETFGPNDTDMTAQLTRVRGANPDAIIVWAIPPAAAIVSKNAGQLGITQPVFHSHGIANKQFIDVAGTAANGVMFPVSKVVVADSLAENDVQKKVLQDYATAYEAKYGAGSLSTFGGHAWDGFSIVTKAIEKAGPDRAKIRDYIENNTKDFVGITGIYSFSPTDHNGLDKRAVTMVEIKDGKWVPAN